MPYTLNTKVRVVETGETGYTRTDPVGKRNVYVVEMDETGEKEQYPARELRAVREEPEPRKPVTGTPGPESVTRLLRF